MNAFDHRKELLRFKIETQRTAFAGQVGALKRQIAPVSVATSLGRLAGGRLGLLGPAAGLLARGPRWSTWLRIATVAYLAVPVVRPLCAKYCRGRKSGAAANGRAAADKA